MGRILIDVDGVVADFTDHLCEEIGRRHHKKPDPKTFTEWDIFKFLDKDQKSHADDILRGHTFWRTQPIIQGAKEAVAAFLAKGHEVHFVTNQWKECHGWADVRVDWVQRNLNIHYDFVHVAGHKYVFSGDVFIDDRPSHVEAWQKEQWNNSNYDSEAFLFDALYNRNFVWPSIRRLKTWADDDSIRKILAIASKEPYTGQLL